ncbi:hypothetical protein THAOC_05486 [Thalassiosira oceanica]|uniref:Uncharacterized protein n=1 Tax=Thalassiosira oceanica TaxID=159749 RepID=K0T2Q2_THAOC|nr:hypothetical protein THAOC_05486 [Thalassiosira oceanica]|eukprot:EJK72933.1 hypothetical protein THAOC_05486 [Thalassiosira oceanica]
MRARIFRGERRAIDAVIRRRYGTPRTERRRRPLRPREVAESCPRTLSTRRRRWEVGRIDPAAISLATGCLRYPKPKSTKPNATKHGKLDHLAMANIGRRCTMEVAEGCIPEQNRPLVPILAFAKAVDPAITYDFGLEVERRSTPHNYTVRRTPPSET